MIADLDRREFLRFLGRTGSTAMVASLAPWTGLLSGCTLAAPPEVLIRGKRVRGIPPSRADELQLAEGLTHQVLIEWDAPLNRKGERFGFNNDYIAWVDRGPNDAILWVNHEYPDPVFLSGIPFERPELKTREHIEIERKALGGSLIRISRESSQKPWRFIFDDPLNRRLDGTTPIPFAWPEKVAGSRIAIGTFANCAGGQTPWGTVLSCEENYQDMFPPAGKKSMHGWENHLSFPSEHYGWVVEVNPLTGSAKKLVSLGRFCHEGATFARAKSGKAVVYMGDDRTDECVFKFISDSENSLERGTLYVAQLEQGRWLPLKREAHPELKKRFSSETELLIHTREAAHIVGGTPLDRPEDIEIDPATGGVIIACTNNKSKGRPHGSLLRIDEKNRDPGAMEFESRTWLAGGEASGLSSPDNLAFDPQGGLWATSDISGSGMGKPPYLSFGNNGLFYIPLQGRDAGKPLRVGNAPVGAEFTGPCFSPDGRTLAVSIQHPGEESEVGKEPVSHWPRGGKEVPRPAVVLIQGTWLG
jgi:secreted PhoX family phosphatase